MQVCVTYIFVEISLKAHDYLRKDCPIVDHFNPDHTFIPNLCLLFNIIVLKYKQVCYFWTENVTT